MTLQCVSYDMSCRVSSGAEEGHRWGRVDPLVSGGPAASRAVLTARLPGEAPLHMPLTACCSYVHACTWRHRSRPNNAGHLVCMAVWMNLSQFPASTDTICQCTEVFGLEAGDAHQTLMGRVAQMAIRCPSSGTQHTAMVCARGCDSFESMRRGSKEQSSKVASPAALQQQAVSPRAEGREEGKPGGEGSGESLIVSPRLKLWAVVVLKVSAGCAGHEPDQNMYEAGPIAALQLQAGIAASQPASRDCRFDSGVGFCDSEC